MVDGHIFANSSGTSREELLDIFRPGDIHSHAYNDRQIELLDRFGVSNDCNREVSAALRVSRASESQCAKETTCMTFGAFSGTSRVCKAGIMNVEYR